MSEQKRTIELTDPRALRAYAHPIRMRLVGLLRRKGELTATQAAELLDESTGTTSFHLRQLAKYGLVEEAGGGTGRQKPWRATALFTQIPDFVASPDLAAAAQTFKQAIAQRYFEQVTAWLGRAERDSEQWQRAADFGDNILFLTPAELTGLATAVNELMEPFLGRLSDPAQRPDGAAEVTFIHLAFPIEAQPGPAPSPAGRPMTEEPES